MLKFNSLLITFLFVLISLFSFSCNSLGLLNEDENSVIPFEIGDSLFFSLQDINPNSATYGNKIGPQSFYGKVVLIYFTTNET